MMLSRRTFLSSSTAALGALGSLSSVMTAANSKALSNKHDTKEPLLKGNFGELISDPHGILDLPREFQYRIISKENDTMTSGDLVPANNDDIGAISAGPGMTLLFRNHAMSTEDVALGKATPVTHAPGTVYDPELRAGGATTLLINTERKLISDHVSISGTLRNCAGGLTPWRTWLTCEKSTETMAKPHGYVFEVDPRSGSHLEPVLGMGRFKHGAVSFDHDGIAYLCEDDHDPFGCFYRFAPANLFGGSGSLHGGGTLSALAVAGLRSDLSVVKTPGIVLDVDWVNVPNANPKDGETPIREQVISLGATPIPEVQETWAGTDGSIWFVCRSCEVHHKNVSKGGHIWRYDPASQTIELIGSFADDTPHDKPKSVTPGPHGFAIASTHNQTERRIVGIAENGQLFPFGLNRLNNEDFSGATFSPDGKTLFVNLRGSPGLSFAIWGPWRKGQTSEFII